MMRWIVGLTLSVSVGCSSNTVDLEDGDGAADGAGTTQGQASGTGDDRAESDGSGGDVLTTGVMTTVGPIDTGDVPFVGPAPGRYLFVVDTIVAPGLPLQWEARIGRDPDTMTGQSLTLDQNSTTSPRELTGGVWDAKFLVEADGSFTIGVVPLAITGNANPITGSDIVTTEMAFESAGPLCGDLVAGDITQPLPLELLGSTFALIPLDEGDVWPVDFPLGC